ncbi:hypothetical protein [Trueperella sp. zg.1013]
MDLKLFEVVERTIQRSGHAPKVTRTTRVTGKGQSRIKKDRRCKGK